MISSTRVAGALALSIVVIASAAGAATAEPAPATLTGEGLEYYPGLPGSLTTTADCDASGNSTISFSVTGVASGPYPGTFEESGTLTVSAPTYDVFGAPSPLYSQVLTLDAQFTIYSGTTTITGEKHLTRTEVRSDNFGFCYEIPGPTFPFATSGHARGVVSYYLSYTATIHEHGRTSTDQGRCEQLNGVNDCSILFMLDVDYTCNGSTYCGGTEGAPFVTISFQESFQSSVGDVYPAQRPGCGRGDTNQAHYGPPGRGSCPAR